MTEQNSAPNELVHYGVKGMKWGVHKSDESSKYRAQTATLNFEPGFHSSTKEAATEVSSLMRDRYGLDLKNIKVLGPGNSEYPGTAAYVEKNDGTNEGTVYIQAHDLRKQLKQTEEIGWMAPGTGNTKGLLTHESAHSLFHADQKVKPGFLAPKITGGHIEARDKALKAALKVAKKDGVSIWSLSGYASNAGVRGELEGELFSQYHWATNPPRFVTEWGKTLHKELGVEPTPFKEVK